MADVSILDLIDHVVDEHDLVSADAMRWAPDAPAPTPDSVTAQSVCEVLGDPLTLATLGGVGLVSALDAPDPTPPGQGQFIQTQRWTATRVAAIYGIPPEMIGASLELEVAMFLDGNVYIPVGDEFYVAELARRERISRMHPQYRRRRRNR